MEKRVQKVVLALFSLFLLSETSLFAQVASQEDEIRIQIWAELDEFPGSFEEDAVGGGEDENFSPVQDPEIPKETEVESEDSRLEPFRFAIDRAKEITPYLLSGMLNGWSFEYTPSDKKRRVEEFFEIIPLKTFDKSVNKIYYRNITVEDSKLTFWAFCQRTGGQKILYQRWNSISYPKVKGMGQASVEKGFEGIQEACHNAVKNGVREYWRVYEKNKPKEISGSILIIGNPRIYIKQGNYFVDLDFFMETDRIIKYSLY